MALYEIIVDEERHTVRVTLDGFWDMATLANYIADLKAAAARVSADGASSWWLLNVGPLVQARDVAEAMGAKLPAVLPPRRKVAVLMNSALSAIQVKRVVPNEQDHHFSTLVDAERWLKEQGMPD